MVRSIHISDIQEINNIIRGKTFRLWKYSVSHNTLLLRSIDENREITDLLFTDVLKVNIPTKLSELHSIESKEYDKHHQQHILIQNDGNRYQIISPQVNCYLFESTDYSIIPYFKNCI